MLAYVGGRWIANGANRTFEVSDPASSAPLACVSALDGDETTGAIEAASTAFPKWRALLPAANSSGLP
ncbi:aldehyde dehydrogenase family protein [Rhizobium leguminosarum]|uniref:aldehyde dehydrogenase family protein n=1 Tax=Rhizobium leguminosarum TaxID=384 RepID=UPI0039656E91